MGLDRLLKLINLEGTPPNLEALAAWTDSDPRSETDPYSAYGSFTDDRGRIIPGDRAPRAWLEFPDPSALVLDGLATADLPPEASVIFLDWGRQGLSWAEIFELWVAWQDQGMVLDGGSVGVAWNLGGRWLCPGWLAFRDGFDGAPLLGTLVVPGRPSAGDEVVDAEPAVVQAEPTETPAAPVPVRENPVPESLLARAQCLRGESAPGSQAAVPEESLPLVPFTLESLKDPGHRWPAGVA